MAKANAIYPGRDDRRFISAAMDAPLLERGHEAELGRRWRDKQDEDALHDIITSHIRLVVRVAAGFRGYGLPLTDLIQEGNVGLMEAAKRFDPERGVRFSTYATWWILAAIQEYIVRNASIVRIGTTPAQKSLFFNIRRMRARMVKRPDGGLTDADRAAIVRDLRVPMAAVERMEAHISGPDKSLNAFVGNDESEEMMDFLPDPGPSPEDTATERDAKAAHAAWLSGAMKELNARERQVIARRFLGEERTTLAEIGETFGVTKERVRQIEGKALSKLRDALGDRFANGDIVLN